MGWITKIIGVGSSVISGVTSYKWAIIGGAFALVLGYAGIVHHSNVSLHEKVGELQLSVKVQKATIDQLKKDIETYQKNLTELNKSYSKAVTENEKLKHSFGKDSVAHTAKHETAEATKSANKELNQLFINIQTPSQGN